MSVEKRITENAVQVSLLVWIRENVSPLVWHCANGGSRHKLEARKLKTLGVMAGVPDLAFIAEHGPDRGKTFYIEVKAPGGVVSDEQKRWSRMAAERNAPVAVVFSKAEGIERCRAWGVTRPPYSLAGAA